MARLLKNLLLTLALIASVAIACSTHRTDSRDTVQYTQEYRRSAEPVTVERHSTTTTETSTNEDTGVVSGTVNVIGEVLALPFRAVGGLIRALF
jgi:outer membrane lipoprotein-sorting protein